MYRQKLALFLLAFTLLPANFALSEDFVVKAESIPLLRPGATVDDTPPKDWSNIIVKSCPAATQGDFKSISNTNKRFTTLFRTVTLAHIVQREIDGKKQFQLSRIGLGVCVPVKDKGDVLISPKTQKDLGAKLGLLGRTILGKIFEEFSRVQVICRSDTSLVFDSPVIYHYKEKNREMVIRYALIVNQEQGRLDTFAWLVEVDDKGEKVGVASKVNWLPENMVCTCDLHVDSKQYSFGIPTKKAFGVTRIPTGKVQFAMPKHLETIAGNESFDSKNANELVDSFRKIVRHQDAKKKAEKPKSD